MRLGIMGAMVALAIGNVGAVTPPQPRIQAAILLDVSNSMDGLIDQARTQLWRMVNEFAKAKKGGVRPTIEVALYEYGNSGLSQSDGYVRRVSPFTTDLDRISELLFALRTNGGDEWCGRVLTEASNGLEWSNEDGDLRVAFIAGNEPFDQGATHYADAISRLRSKGVRVVPIFCGDRSEGILTHWIDGATLGRGIFLTIDQNKAVAEVAAPQDAEIARLGVELNQTYVAYGDEGTASQARQSAQDTNAWHSGSAVSRALTKASANYSNAHWDLVDALRSKKCSLTALTDAQRKAALAAGKRRDELQARIAALGRERAAFLATTRTATPASDTLEGAMTQAIHRLADEAGFHFE